MTSDFELFGKTAIALQLARRYASRRSERPADFNRQLQSTRGGAMADSAATDQTPTRWREQSAPDRGRGGGGVSPVFGVGSVFAGYRVERVLGAGGMGTVYLGRNPDLPRSEAVKVLSA